MKILLTGNTADELKPFVAVLKERHKLSVAIGKDKVLQIINDKGLPDILAAHDSIAHETEYLKNSVPILILDKTDNIEQKIEDCLLAHDKSQKDAAVFFGLLETIAMTAEFRGEYRPSHAKKLYECVKLLCGLIKNSGKQLDITEKDAERIVIGSILHDIGCIAVSDSVLLGKQIYDENDTTEMHRHVLAGKNIAETMHARLGENLVFAPQIAHSHHEKWDGSGYPDGLKGLEIPLCARITAAADVYCALVSSRGYREPFSHDEAVAVIAFDGGAGLDPDICGIFLENAEKFRKIALMYAENDAEVSAAAIGMDGIPLLIAEDQEINAEMLKAKLESLGFRADIAENGRQALRMLENNHYAAVLTDINMPIMDGVTLLKNIRQRYGAIKVFAVTGDDDVKTDTSFGFDGHLKKPVDGTALASVLSCFGKTAVSSVRLDTELSADIDFSELESVINDREKVIKLYDNFIISAESEIMMLKQAAETLDAERCAKHAHTLKGASSTAGAKEMGKICASAEDYFRNNDFTKADKLINDIIDIFARVKIEVKNRYECTDKY